MHENQQHVGVKRKKIVKKLLVSQFCHSERSEESVYIIAEILHFVQDDK